MTLINTLTNEKQTVNLIHQDEYLITAFPKVINGYYVKYSLDNKSFCDSDDVIRFNNKKVLYYTNGIKEDYFKIKSVGNVFTVKSLNCILNTFILPHSGH